MAFNWYKRFTTASTGVEDAAPGYWTFNEQLVKKNIPQLTLQHN